VNHHRDRIARLGLGPSPFEAAMNEAITASAKKSATSNSRGASAVSAAPKALPLALAAGAHTEIRGEEGGGREEEKEDLVTAHRREKTRRIHEALRARAKRTAAESAWFQPLEPIK
jgi:cytochrome b